MALKYRREVDGLRAIAVIPVVLFHAALGFPGGFVGVDVFFVISGYLITSLILKDGEAFSLASFWERRVRRIFPAVSAMVLACLVAGWFTLFPRDFLQLGRSVVAQALLVSNVFFWRDLNYFAENETRPLLHTWSLAVEEQFYLLLPFALYALRRSPRRKLVMIVAAGALLSFAAGVYGVRARPQATFYLLPPRAWELLLGSLIAALPDLRSKKRWINEALSGVGLLSVLLAAWFYHASMPFPGEAALLPCLGAAAVIVGTSSTPTLVGSFLSLGPVVWVGTISYSLYLLHWPVLTFAHYELRSVSALASVGLVLASLVFAWLSWKFIEQPVRTRASLVTSRQLFTAAGLTILGFSAAGLAIARTGGIASRWRPETLRYAEGRNDADFRVELGLDSVQREELIKLGVDDARLPVELLVWGDSHAMAILHVADQVCRDRGLRCLAATHSSTPPLLDYPTDGTFSLREDALPFARAINAFVAKHRVPRVLLAANWPGIEGEDRRGQLQASLGLTVRALRDGGAQVMILSDVPFPGFDVPIALANASVFGEDVARVGVNLADHVAAGRRVNAMIQALPRESVVVLEPLPWFSDGTGLCRVEREGRPLYFDHHHLSTFGAMQLRPLFERVFAASHAGLP